MKNLFKYLLLFCIFCNFFSNTILSWLGLRSYDKSVMYGFVSESFFTESSKEMLLIFVCLIIISYVVKFNYQVFDLKYYQKRYKADSVFVLCSWAFFLFFVLFVFLRINWDYDVSNRGIAQFELDNRQTLFQGIVFNFYLPFLLYLYIVGFFKNRLFLLLGALSVFLLQGILEGGRGNLVTIIIIGILVLYYVHRFNKKVIVLSIIIGFIALTFTAKGRFETHDSIIENNIVKILQCNSSSEFLGVVKYSIHNGISLSPKIFGMHFVSIFIPSYVYVHFFHLISYTRSSFVFNELYNTNPNSGLGFMMLADFYWCFKYWGYVLYLLTFYLVLKFFKKFIYSYNPVLVVMSLYIIYRFCDQRIDFGAFVKPVVYTFIFLSILEFLRKRAIISN